MNDCVHGETKGESDDPVVFTFHGTGGDKARIRDFARRLRHPAESLCSCTL